MWPGLRGVGLLVMAAGCGRIGFDAAANTGSMADVTFDGSTKAADLPTDPATAPSDGERLQIGDMSCPTYTGQTSQPYRAVLVENAGAKPVVVSAWATCAAGDMGVLSFFRRDTPPLTRSERMACDVGVTDSGSPAAGSAPCPGMLASAQRGLSLAVGDRAIVWLQGEGTTLPALLHIEAQ